MSSECSFGPDYAVSERSATPSENLEMEIKNLQIENSLLRTEVSDRRADSRVARDVLLQSDIAGSWKLLSSSNVEEYLEKRGASEVEDIVFRVGDVHFEFDQDHQKLTVFNVLCNKKYNEKTIELGEPKDGSLTFFTSHSMKTICLGGSGDSEDVEVEEVTLKHRRLHIVNKTCQVRCERVYQRKPDDYLDEDKEVEMLEAANLAIQKLELDNALLSAELKKPQKKEETDVRKEIIGTWKSIGAECKVTMEVHGDRLMIRWFNDKKPIVYRIGDDVTVEENRIVRSIEYDRWEHYVKDGEMFWDWYYFGTYRRGYCFKRIGSGSPV